LRAHPKLVADILREGSWAPDEPTRQLWTGLLVSSCSTDVPDDSNEVLVDLLVHITPVEAKILIYACERALSCEAEVENAASDPIVLNPEQMVDLTGIYDLYRDATDLAYLFNLGLIRNVFDFTWYKDAECFDITPSIIGLELYKHCHGSREKLDPHLIEEAREHLLDFLPQVHCVATYDSRPAAPDGR